MPPPREDDAFNRTWWSVLSIDKLVTWQHLSTERTGGHVMLKASSCLRSLVILSGGLSNGLMSGPVLGCWIAKLRGSSVYFSSIIASSLYLTLSSTLWKAR